jgi:hypothetical protein
MFSDVKKGQRSSYQVVVLPKKTKKKLSPKRNAKVRMRKKENKSE